ncbi:DUF262 domain-containing protein [Ahniella affigens]|uniref:DUF262 domain-containing protein n=1 Tax=Ahniella affigens TaxID=2021234 RepID=A0A2P1PRE5_9GAMM|nr:DUF262 domain-containing protein [Ahniella affigens]AVP97398.1 DUF262 domain-containing protein [Ahniella affigens]
MTNSNLTTSHDTEAAILEKYPIEDIEDNLDDDSVQAVKYSISSFGVDYDTEGAVRRLKRGDIAVPDFQRSYVWNISEASRLVESLLLGLPVPGVFLAAEHETKQLLVIDGQQRLKSLLFFYEGFFNPIDGETTRRVFSLQKVQKHLEGKTYATLSEEERRTLDNAVIHATVVRQDSPENDDTGMYHIFERLNTGGRKLVPQEIRTAVYRGQLISALSRMNANPDWRAIYGPSSPRLKDQELITRYLAFRTGWQSYQAPMTDFISSFCKKNQNIADADSRLLEQEFSAVIALARSSLGDRAFRPKRALNAALLEAFMVALSSLMQSNQGSISQEKIASSYSKLIADPGFISAISKSTANEKNVQLRFLLAKQYLEQP